ncbi:MAG TPA: single-stranded-DNA-specific exonuclease RecJ [Gammaproteobacteria bacterium]|nr:single-stranded-DNA-specific exonuclease RecJ [Gammaproteobacteria bacterium]
MRKRIRRRPLLRDPAELPAHLPAVVRRVYAARAVAPDELECSLARLHPGESLSGLKPAVELLEAALAERLRILVIGDFDADGATSSALAVRALRAFGHADVDYLVPNRFEYGYGLTPEIVELARERQPDLLITVDNGISSIAGTAAAKAAGMRVLITDHHLPGDTLPAADAIVNPNMHGDDFPSKHLAGVGVIFYVMLALRARLREKDWFRSAGIPEPNMAELLDLVALGTVADVVVLDFNNRILIDQGIRRIRAGRCCPGILALLQDSGRDPARLVAADLGFAVGPRLNAAGRLEDMSLGIACLLSDDPDQAAAMAAQLGELNQQRRKIEGVMQEEALTLLSRLEQNEAGLPPGLCLMDPGWHQGVIGILAGRIKDRFYRPVIAFAPAGEGELKGSARSIQGLHIRDLLERIATRNPGLIAKFGGHAMAAGLSLAADDFPRFEAAFAAAVAEELSDEMLARELLTDGELAPDEYDLRIAEALRDAGPWGQGFPEPLFDGLFEISQNRIVGGRHVKLTMQQPNGGRWLDAIAFNGVEYGWHELRQAVRLAYRLDVNEFRGRRSVQLLVEYMEPA